MNPIKHTKPHRRWLRFGLRSLLALTFVAALVSWYFAPRRVVYHSSVASWKKFPIGVNHYALVLDPPVGLVSYVHYSDEDQDGVIDARVQGSKNGLKRIISVDEDHDGFFDTEFEEGRYNASIFWWKVQRIREVRIHIPVPTVNQ